jgi:hypothetical protein
MKKVTDWFLSVFTGKINEPTITTVTAVHFSPTYIINIDQLNDKNKAVLIESLKVMSESIERMNSAVTASQTRARCD